MKYDTLKLIINLTEGEDPTQADLSTLTPDTYKKYIEFSKHPLARKYRWEVISTLREPEHNARVGGATKSLHIQGRALDLSFKKFGNLQPNRSLKQKTKDLLIAAYETGFTGFGVGSTALHIDTRQNMGNNRFKDGRQFSTWDYGNNVNSRVLKFLIQYDEEQGSSQPVTTEPEQKRVGPIELPTKIDAIDLKVPKIQVPTRSYDKPDFKLPDGDDIPTPIPATEIKRFEVIKKEVDRTSERQGTSNPLSILALMALLVGGVFAWRRFAKKRGERKAIEEFLANPGSAATIRRLRRENPTLVKELDKHLKSRYSKY